MPGCGGSVTRLLSELREGNQEAANQLVPLVYGELRRMVILSRLPRWLTRLTSAW
jgi:hypothetical protein